MRSSLSLKKSLFISDNYVLYMRLSLVVTSSCLPLSPLPQYHQYKTYSSDHVQVSCYYEKTQRQATNNGLFNTSFASYNTNCSIFSSIMLYELLSTRMMF